MEDKNVGMAVEIAKAAAEKGGAVYYVGGFVRDRVRKKENKDVDIEVHGIYPRDLEEILDSLGERIAIGESFGIYNLKGYSIDIAMPRKEEKRGLGHRDFDICTDPFLGTYKAAKRRDFTMNALMENVLTGEIIDHFGGVHDIEEGKIRHIADSTFREDPLRVLRAAQFAARFGYDVAEETTILCSKMDLSALPKERIVGETEKALLKSEKPSVFFEVLRKMGQLKDWFCELEKAIGVEQNPKYHAEGDVWTHTMMVCDEAAKFREKVQNPLGFMLAAVAHDFGKVVCTETVNGELHAYRHEILGLPLVESFMNRLTAEKELILYVMNLAEYHMKPNEAARDKSSIKATNKMFDKAIDPEGLIWLAIADGLGKKSEDIYYPCDEFLCKRLEIYREYMKRPYVMGRDLIEAGIKPSERFGEYLQYAHKLRLAGVEKESALRQTLAYIRKWNLH